MATPTARDAEAAQRLWQARELSDADVDRALADLVTVTAERDRAGQLVRRLAKVWPRDVLRRAEQWLAETEAPKPKAVEQRPRW